MKTGKPRFGLADMGVLTGFAVLIGFETVAFLAGWGPVAGVVVLGYALVLGLAYLVYRQAISATSRRQELKATQALTEVEVSLDERILKDVDIFNGLTDEQIDSIAALGELLTIPAGHGLGIASEQGDRIFIVVQGMAQLTADSAIGDVTVRIAGPGESFPLAVLIGSGMLITSIKTMTDMVLMAIPRIELLELFRNEPEIGMQVYAGVAEVLGSRYARTLSRLTTNAEKALKEADFFANV